MVRSTEQTVVEALENVFDVAIGKVPKELRDACELIPVENRKRFRVSNGARRLDVDVVFYETLSAAANPNADLSAMSQKALGLPTIGVTCIGYEDVSSYPLRQLEQFAAELADDIVRKVKFAQRMLQI